MQLFGTLRNRNSLFFVVFTTSLERISTEVWRFCPSESTFSAVSGIVSEDYSSPRKPRELDCRGRHHLQAGKINGRLPAFEVEVAINLEVLADTFDLLQIDVVQSGSIGNQDLCTGYGLRCRAGNKVPIRLLIPPAGLNPLITALWYVTQARPPLSSRPIQSPRSWPWLVCPLVQFLPSTYTNRR